MISKAPRIAITLLALALAAGCAESDREEVTGEAKIRGLNAIVDAPDAAFRIEERTLQSLPFAGVSSAGRWDDLGYTFNFDISVPGETTPRRLASEFLDVQPDMDYLFVLDGSVANPQIRLFEQEERQWDGTETVFELNFAHLNGSAGPVDVYVAEDGIAPAAGNEVASIAEGEFTGPFEFPEGTYVVTLTPSGDPQTLLYTSPARTFAPSTTDTIVVLDKDPARTGPLAVRQVTGAGDSIELPDLRFLPQVRIVHSAAGVGPVDLAVDGDFTNLVAANLARGEISADTEVPAGESTYTFTDAGNQGAVIVEDDEVVTTGFFGTMVLVGPASEPAILNSVSVRRPYSTSGRFAFVHAAESLENIDLYLLPAGESIEDNAPLSSGAPFPLSSGLGAVAAGAYEATVTPAGETTVLAGPEPLAIANGEVVQLFILETADPNVGELVVVRY